MAGSHSDSRLCPGGTWHQLERRFWRHWSRKPLWGLDDEQARHKVLGVCAKTQPRAQGKGRDIHVRRQGLPGGGHPVPRGCPSWGIPGAAATPAGHGWVTLRFLPVPMAAAGTPRSVSPCSGGKSFYKELAPLFAGTPEIKILPPLPLFLVDPPCECVSWDASAFLPGSFRPKLRGLQVRVEGLTSAAADLGFPGRYLCMCRDARDPLKLVVRNSS